MVGSTSDTLPTNPRSAWLGAAVMRLASSPDMPTASGPCTLMAETMSRLTLPTSTMRAMSSVSASVTRRPLRNSVSLPRRAISSPICGPPPCTTTGRMPTARISTTSWANEASASGPVGRRRRSVAGARRVQRVAAVLDDDDLAPEAPDVGQGLDQHRGGLGRGRLLRPGDLGRHRQRAGRASRGRPVLVDVAVAEVRPEHDRLARSRGRGRSRSRRGAPPCGPPPPPRRAARPRRRRTPRCRRRPPTPGRCRRACRPSPSSETIRPQYGSSPLSEHWTSMESATLRAARWAASSLCGAADPDVGHLGRPLGVVDHLLGQRPAGLGERRGERGRRRASRRGRWPAPARCRWSTCSRRR